MISSENRQMRSSERRKGTADRSQELMLPGQEVEIILIEPTDGEVEGVAPHDRLVIAGYGYAGNPNDASEAKMPCIQLAIPQAMTCHREEVESELTSPFVFESVNAGDDDYNDNKVLPRYVSASSLSIIHVRPLQKHQVSRNRELEQMFKNGVAEIELYYDQNRISERLNDAGADRDILPLIYEQALRRGINTKKRPRRPEFELTIGLVRNVKNDRRHCEPHG